MAEQPYHKYVFDVKNRKFVGKFEQMYANEEKGQYDSWYQEDISHLGRQISLTILNRYNFASILDLGCGKGAFAHLLKKANNRVVGIDISRTAIEKAKTKYRDIEFLALPIEKAFTLSKKWDLVVMMEILSYIENWKVILKNASECAAYLYISLYIPPNPIGFVKNFDELREEIARYFFIDTELILNSDAIFILAKGKKNN